MLDALEHYQRDVLVLCAAETFNIGQPLRAAQLLDAHVAKKGLKRWAICAGMFEIGEIVHRFRPVAIELAKKEPFNLGVGDRPPLRRVKVVSANTFAGDHSWTSWRVYLCPPGLVRT